MFVLTDEQTSQMLGHLISYCEDYSLKVSNDALRSCIEHLDLVLEANKTTNLTRILNIEDAAVLHILDSLVLLPYIDIAPEGALLDMGTGAGFPGIPLTIASGRKATYIDSVGKKVDAVNSFVEALGLKHAHTVHDRLEEYARSHKKQFAVVTARALAPLPVLVEYASPFLIDSGLFVITKGNPSDVELQSGLNAATICGFTTLMTDDLDLPNGLGHREFIILKKSRPASISLPRANGMAKKNPLA
ncbi:MULTISPECIES: 16S rRNA (guanine(527)-N(7))-methyltransferase RsmG [unclassified Collinsella]|uniref:16S rRNA (guanine(527)-N(7))-methyltransferase RsmG n=1 Tax=unclassified Collinsella TaxID=2637548 RepID=UPI003F92589E